MNRSGGARWFFFIGVLGLGVLATIWFTPGRQASGTLPDYGGLPAVAMTDHLHRPFSLADMHGSVWVTDFIFTRCTGQCPKMTLEMVKIQRIFRYEPELQFVSFSIDPQHDTPEVLAAFAKRYGVDDTRWRFVTGEPGAVQSLATDGFLLATIEGTGMSDGIPHSVRLILMDRRSHIRGYYSTTDAKTMKQLRFDIVALLQEPAE